MSYKMVYIVFIFCKLFAFHNTVECKKVKILYSCFTEKYRYMKVLRIGIYVLKNGYFVKPFASNL